VAGVLPEKLPLLSFSYFIEKEKRHERSTNHRGAAADAAIPQ